MRRFKKLVALMSVLAFLVATAPQGSFALAGFRSARYAKHAAPCCAGEVCCCQGSCCSSPVAASQDTARESCCDTYERGIAASETTGRLSEQPTSPNAPPACPCCPNGCCGCCTANTACFPGQVICLIVPAPCVGLTCSETSLLFPPAPLSEVLQPPRV